MDEVVELSIRIRFTLVEEVGEFQEIVFVVAVTDQCL